MKPVLAGASGELTVPVSSLKGVDVARSKCRVLVVDDNQDAAESLAQLLVSLGYETVFLTDPRQVSDMVSRFKPDLALLDIGMPYIDGWDLARDLRKQFPEKLKMVALTAYGAPADHIRSRRAGFDAHLVKPASIALLEATIATLWSAN